MPPVATPLKPLSEVVDLGAEFARGGFMAVRRGTWRAGGDSVVVKTPLADPGGLAARLAREAAALSGVAHPNLARFYGLFSGPGGAPAMVYEFVPGRALRDELAAGPVARPRAGAVAADVAAGLDALHAAGLVCRDVKPDNVVSRPDGRAVLVDFGLVRDETGGTMTAAGLVMGTPAYLAPEAWQGRRFTAASDRYALAVMVYELLAGAPPFSGEVTDLARAHLGADPPPVAGLGAAAWEALRAGLAKAPAARPAEAGAWVARVFAARPAPPASTTRVGGEDLGGGRAGRGARTRSIGAGPPLPRPGGVTLESPALPAAAGGAAVRGSRGRAAVIGVAAAAGAALLFAASDDRFRGAPLGASGPAPTPGVGGRPASGEGPPPDVPGWVTHLPDLTRRMRHPSPDLRDPLGWGDATARYRAVEGFRRWSWGHDWGDPPAPGVRAAAAAADRVFDAEDIPSPFRPFFEVLPGAAPPRSRSPDGPPEWWFELERVFRAPVTGWRQTALAAALRAADRLREMEADVRKVRQGIYPLGVKSPAHSRFFGMATDRVYEYLPTVYSAAGDRRRIYPWVREGESALQRTLVAMARAARAGEATWPEVREHSRRCRDQLYPLGFGRVAGMAARDLTGVEAGPGASPLLAAALASAERVVHRVRKDASLDLAEVWDRVAGYWLLSLRDWRSDETRPPWWEAAEKWFRRKDRNFRTRDDREEFERRWLDQIQELPPAARRSLLAAWRERPLAPRSSRG